MTAMKTSRTVNLVGYGEDDGWWWTKALKDSYPLSGAQGVDFDGPYPTEEEATADAV